MPSLELGRLGVAASGSGGSSGMRHPLAASSGGADVPLADRGCAADL